jgi:hypothetical protein
MARIAIPAGIGYTEITSGAAPATFQFQNVGVHSLMVAYAAAKPADGALAAIFKPGEGDRPTGDAAGVRAWARTVPPSLSPGEVDVTVT